jgi:hypothetical protein
MDHFDMGMVLLTRVSWRWPDSGEEHRHPTEKHPFWFMAQAFHFIAGIFCEQDHSFKHGRGDQTCGHQSV